MPRIIEPELLDFLPPGNPEAQRSRLDLQRVNYLLNNSGILARQLHRHLPMLAGPQPCLRVVEIGAGDGTVMLSLARRLHRSGVSAHAVLIDRQPAVSKATHDAFTALGWTVELLVADVFDCFEQTISRADVVIANMVLHHFQDADLKSLFTQITRKTDLLIVCEPRRSRMGVMAPALLWLLGCCTVTRYDGPVSIRSGFRDQEISLLWPSSEDWQVDERAASPFIQRFTARRRVSPAAALSR